MGARKRVCGLQLSWLSWWLTLLRTKHPLQAHIPELIRHLQHHGVYEAIFETFFLEEARSFYAGESEALYQTLSEKQLLDHCEKRHMQERQRAGELIPRETIKELLDIVDKALLCERLEWLAKGGMTHGTIEVPSLTVTCRNSTPDARTGGEESGFNVRNAHESRRQCGVASSFQDLRPGTPIACISQRGLIAI